MGRRRERLQRSQFRSCHDVPITIPPSNVGFMGDVVCKDCGAKKWPGESAGLCCGQGRHQSFSTCTSVTFPTSWNSFFMLFIYFASLLSPGTLPDLWNFLLAWVIGTFFFILVGNFCFHGFFLVSGTLPDLWNFFFGEALLLLFCLLWKGPRSYFGILSIVGILSAATS
jgi:hypothetical protein